MEPTQSCPVLTGRWQKVAMFCFQKGLQMSWFRVEDNLPRSLARKTAGKQDLSDISMSYHKKFTCESCFQWLPPLFPTSSSYLPPEAFLAFFKGLPGFPGWKDKEMAEESTGSELKLIQKFINMSVCLNSIFVSKNHQAIKLCASKIFWWPTLGFWNFSFQNAKGGAKASKNKQPEQRTGRRFNTALCRLDCPYAAARKASHREKLL